MLGLLKMLVKGCFQEHTKALKRIITSLYNLEYYLGLDSNEEVGETSLLRSRRHQRRRRRRSRRCKRRRPKRKARNSPVPPLPRFPHHPVEPLTMMSHFSPQSRFISFTPMTNDLTLCRDQTIFLIFSSYVSNIRYGCNNY